MQSGRSQSMVDRIDTRGKHRIQAELKRLDQEARFLEFMLGCQVFSVLEFIFKSFFWLMHGGCQLLYRYSVLIIYLDNYASVKKKLTLCKNIDAVNIEEELEHLEKMEKASTACKELLSKVESAPDPLLPITNGPLNLTWDRWFEGPQESQGCKCWIL
ncbi:guanine nucleotide-binding protein subunit gamma 2-like [Gossypium australe]|uniref:Guanine nucleotide-binding protein subunit gamma 2-like n=1 Tax=Gossypium australe TaxID=47621 RepID=A0A5B6UBC7_9ROSI|nr:guanine nucleotide-binding protein subunit gamma 2-like [Gossypium australe]